MGRLLRRFTPRNDVKGGTRNDGKKETAMTGRKRLAMTERGKAFSICLFKKYLSFLKVLKFIIQNA
jgi:hypothetical protein